MDGVTGVVERIAQIQSRIDQISPQRAASSSSSFDVVLGTVLSQTARTVPSYAVAAAPQAVATAVGSGASLVDSDGIPVALKTYGNGRVPAEALSSVDGTSHTLWAPAARSLEALRSAAAADGVTVGITDAYRTYASQVDLVQRKGLYSQGGLAAAPGTSRHGWGVAVDLSLDSTAQAWMRTNGGRFGFHENVAREPWHWEYEPLTA